MGVALGVWARLPHTGCCSSGPVLRCTSLRTTQTKGGDGQKKEARGGLLREGMDVLGEWVWCGSGPGRWA